MFYFILTKKIYPNRKIFSQRKDRIMDGDYIKDLTEEEKLVFIKVFSKLIKSDNIANKAEIQFLDVIATRYGIAKNKVIEIIKNSDYENCLEEVKKIRTRATALELIKEMCVLANIDNNLDDGELDFLLDIANSLGIEEDKIILINRWVLDSFIMEKAGKIIMEKDDDE